MIDDDKGLQRVWMLLQIATISGQIPTLKAITKAAMDELLEHAAEHAGKQAVALQTQREREAAEEAERQKQADGIAALRRKEEEDARQEKLVRDAKYAKDALDREAKAAALVQVKAHPKVIPGAPIPPQPTPTFPSPSPTEPRMPTSATSAFADAGVAPITRRTP